MAYNIKLDIFEGPFDLLLHLIRRQEINICDIPLAKLAQEYLAYLETMPRVDINVASEFLIMAVTLLYLKSKMLLPLEEEEIEEVEEVTPPEELVEQFWEYQRYKEVAKGLEERALKQRAIFSRFEEGEQLAGEGLLLEVSPFDLLVAFERIIGRISMEGFQEIDIKMITIEDKIAEILKRLKERKVIRFLELFEAQFCKLELVVTFLALLELIRLRSVFVRQVMLFGDIWIYESNGQGSAIIAKNKRVVGNGVIEDTI